MLLWRAPVHLCCHVIIFGYCEKFHVVHSFVVQRRHTLNLTGICFSADQGALISDEALQTRIVWDGCAGIFSRL